MSKISFVSIIAMLTTEKKVDRKGSDKVSQANEMIKWSWACRILDKNNEFKVDNEHNVNEPAAGDVAVFRVSRIGNHGRIVSSDNRKIRIYPGDLIVGVFGNRYATDAFEAEIEGLKDLSLLTAAGMVGTVKSKHYSVGRPTRLSFVGFLTDMSDHKVNLKETKFKKSEPTTGLKNLVIIVGAGMNSGKTTACRRLIKSFSQSGYRVAAFKLTGSVSNRDQDEMSAAAASHTLDFSDFGFPSTYKCAKEELIDLFKTMVASIEKVNPDVALMEIADGVLQRETHLLLSDPLIKQSAKGIVLTAESATSALYVVEHLKRMGYRVIAVSGAITSSPLYVKEFEQNCNIPVLPSIGDDEKIPQYLVNLIREKRPKKIANDELTISC
jgi:hypothetical protein